MGKGRATRSIGGARRAGRARKWFRHGLLAAFVAVIFGIACIAAIDLRVSAVARGHIHSSPEDAPVTDVALVLGTSRSAPGGLNLFYLHRIEAAAELYNTGRVRGILVSGDNSRKGYNEPEAMKADLVEAGVPAEFITCDYAGFRTLDSVVRAREVFGQESFLVVSQHFHCERAIYLGRARGLSVEGYAAEDAPASVHLRVRARETLARVKAWLDVHVLQTRPRFLGAPEELPLRSEPDESAMGRVTTYATEPFLVI